MPTTMSDRIEKKVLLKAPRARVWRALTDAQEFGRWFGVKFDDQFVPGAPIHGVIVPTTVDADVAKAQEPYTGMPFDVTVEAMEPERRFAFRWHPGAIDPNIDYSKEPTTLVEFLLEEVADGVMLTVVESGFDRSPLSRRATAFTMNEGGWTMMVGIIQKYVSHGA